MEPITGRTPRGDKEAAETSSDWLQLEAPELRIISNELWERVHVRHEAAQRAYLRMAGGRLRGRPAVQDLQSKYLLTGLVQCSICGGSITTLSRKKGQYVRKVYGCAYHRSRGASVCSNNVEIKQDVLEHALIDAIVQVLDERVLETAVEQALKKLREEHAAYPDRRLVLERELSLIETRLRHLVEAIARGQGTEVVFTTLQAEEGRKKAILEELGAVDGIGRVVSLEPRRIAADLRSRLGDVKGLLTRHIPQARQMLRKLVDGRLQCEPYEADGKRGFRFYGTGTYARLLSEAKTGGL